MARKLTLSAHWDQGEKQYVAIAYWDGEVDLDCLGYGASPDEARGCLLRELDMAGALEIPLIIDVETEEEEADDGEE